MSKTNSKIVLDPKKFWLSEDDVNINEQYGVTTSMIGRPELGSYFRTHPAPDYMANVGVVEHGRTGPYIVTAKLCEELEQDVTVKRLYTTIDRAGKVRLWLLHVPDYDYYARGLCDWNRTALEAAEVAKDEWIRIQWNAIIGCYLIQRAPEDFGDPGFDKIPSFEALFEKAFAKRLITNEDHPVIEGYQKKFSAFIDMEGDDPRVTP